MTCVVCSRHMLYINHPVSLWPCLQKLSPWRSETSAWISAWQLVEGSRSPRVGYHL